MTDQEWLDYVRSLLHEPETLAKFWTPAEIALYKKVGITIVATEFFNNLAITHKKLEIKDMTKDDPYITSPTNLWKVVRIEKASTKDKLRYMEDDENWRLDITGTPKRWMWEDNKIRQVPIPEATETGYWNVWHLPKFTTLAQLPEELHPLSAIEAIISARIKDENVTKALLLRRDHLFRVATKSMAIAQLQEGEALRDFDLDEEDESWSD